MVVSLRCCLGSKIRLPWNSIRRYSVQNGLHVGSVVRSEYRYARSYRGKVKAVIFDWAGTIVDHGCFAPVVAFRNLFRSENVEISVDQARRPMGAHKRVHIEKILDDDGVRSQWKSVHRSEANASDVDRMYAAFQAIMLDCLNDHSDLIPGVAETVAGLRRDYGLKIGTTTGFPTSILDVLVSKSAKAGFTADSNVAADQVPAARPCPHMVWSNAIKMDVHPIGAIVKVDDTIDGLLEGLSAGCWTVGVAKTGNYMGATAAELESLSPEVLERRLNRAYDILYSCGAHYVVDDVSSLPSVVGEINMRLADGEKP